MEISTKVKHLFYLETNDIYQIDNFTGVYNLTKHIIEYNIDVEGISGLSDRLPYALNHVAEIAEKGITRQDVMTFFPIIWNKFEAYAKKILFIADREGFNTLAISKDNTLPDYLKRLNVPYFKQGNLSPVAQAYIHARYLRNTEAHDCERWSLHKYCIELAYSLLSYLLLTSYCIEKLKSAIKDGNLLTAIPILPEKYMSVTNPRYFVLLEECSRLFPGADFSELKRMNITGNGEEVSYYFDRNGDYTIKARLQKEGEIETTEIQYKWENGYHNNYPVLNLIECSAEEKPPVVYSCAKNEEGLVKVIESSAPIVGEAYNKKI